MAGDESVEIIFFVEVVGIVVPAAHIRTGSGEAFTLAKRLEHGVFVEFQKCFVIVDELFSEGAVQELHLRIAEQR